MSNSSDLRLVHIRDYPTVTKDVLETLPISLVRQKMIVPLSKDGGRLTAAVPKAEGILKPQGLQMIAHCPVDLVLAPLDEIIEFIKKYYGDEIRQEGVVAVAPPALPAPFARVLEEAIQNKASELLIDKSGERVRVRQRIRGVLMSDLNARLLLEDVNHIADFVAKNAKHQTVSGVDWFDWRFDYPVRGDSFSCTAVVSKTNDFWLFTLRISSHQQKIFSPAAWGMGPHQAGVLEKLLKRNQGLLLFCGTDSDDFLGNVRACAKELSTSDRHVISVSDSPKEWFPGVEQLVSGENSDLFNELLKLAFKHEPDVVLVDPFERPEAIDLCLREAMRGRLIMSHCYAQDAAEALVYVLGMKADPPLVGASLLGIVAQRTLRLNCPRCQDKDPVHRDRIRDMGIPVAMQPPAFYRGKGCEACLKTGFDREASIFEVIEMTDDLRGRLSRDTRAEDIRTVLKSNGILTLRQVAIHKAVNGQTSLAEVLRTTP